MEREGHSIKIQDTATPVLTAIRKSEHDRSELHSFIASRASELVRDHLFGLHRHATAERLGAEPTFYNEAIARGVEGRADARAAYVELPTGSGEAEAFARVWGDVTITPRTGKYLTLPALGIAYGKRARTFADLVFIPFGNGTKALCRKEVTMVPGKRKAEIKKVKLIPFYWLRESVHLKQDRTLLPSDEAFATAAEAGAEAWLVEQMSKAQELP